jgi:pyroglutamyl-peptidase
MPNGVCAMASNPVDYRPLLRGALVNLDRWVKDGTPPPASRYPRLADGTLVEKNEVAAFPGFTAAKAPSQRPRYDYGPDFDKGIIGKAFPTVLSDSYRVLVPKVDADATKSLACDPRGRSALTSAGWNVRAPTRAAPANLCYLEAPPCLRQDQGRARSRHDPRLSLEERYHDNSAYAERVRRPPRRSSARATLPRTQSASSTRRARSPVNESVSLFGGPAVQACRIFPAVYDCDVAFTLLLTGFGPFGRPSTRPGRSCVSWRADAMPLVGVRRVAHVFATSYQAVDRELPELIAREAPQVVLMFGLATRTPYLRIERCARNGLSCIHPDATGVLPFASMIAPGAPATRALRAPLQRLLAAAHAWDIPAALSHDAGRYLCNYLCWRASGHAARPETSPSCLCARANRAARDVFAQTQSSAPDHARPSRASGRGNRSCRARRRAVAPLTNCALTLRARKPDVPLRHMPYGTGLVWLSSQEPH